MISRAVVLAASLTLAGCASSSQIMMADYGKNIAQLSVRMGAPIASFDMGDGRRAFQWSKSGTQVSGGQTGQMGGGFTYTAPIVLSSNTCVFTIYAKKQAGPDILANWIVMGHEPPKGECE